MRIKRTGVIPIQGMKETLHALRGVHRIAFEAAAAQIIGPSAEPVIADAKALLVAHGNVDTGALRDSIGVLVKVKPNKRIMFAVVGPVDEGVDNKGRRPVKYAHLIEFGVAPHSLKKGSAVSMKKARANAIFTEKAERLAEHKDGFAFEVDYKKALLGIARNFLVFRDARAGAAISKGFVKQPFMRPAWDKNKEGVFQAVSFDLGVLIEKKAAELYAAQTAAQTEKTNREDFRSHMRVVKSQERFIRRQNKLAGSAQ